MYWCIPLFPSILFDLWTSCTLDVFLIARLITRGVWICLSSTTCNCHRLWAEKDDSSCIPALDGQHMYSIQGIVNECSLRRQLYSPDKSRRWVCRPTVEVISRNLTYVFIIRYLLSVTMLRPNSNRCHWTVLSVGLAENPYSWRIQWGFAAVLTHIWSRLDWVAIRHTSLFVLRNYRPNTMKRYVLSSQL